MPLPGNQLRFPFHQQSGRPHHESWLNTSLSTNSAGNPYDKQPKGEHPAGQFPPAIPHNLKPEFRSKQQRTIFSFQVIFQYNRYALETKMIFFPFRHFTLSAVGRNTCRRETVLERHQSISDILSIKSSMERSCRLRYSSNSRFTLTSRAAIRKQPSTSNLLDGTVEVYLPSDPSSSRRRMETTSSTSSAGASL